MIRETKNTRSVGVPPGTGLGNTALEVAEAEGQLVSAQTIRCTLQQIGLHGHRPRRKPLLKLAHK